MNRRKFVRLGMAVAGMSGITSTRILGETGTWSGDAFTSAQAIQPQGEWESSIRRGYEFLAFAMDAYQQGRTTRIIQTYSDNAGLGSTAFVADSALAILAFLRRGRRNDMDRAKLLGDSLLYAQSHDPVYTDGRLRDAYWVGPFNVPNAKNVSYFVRNDGTVNLVGAPWNFVASTVGGLAWVGIALAQLFAHTHDARYLEGSLRLAQWIVDNAFDIVGPGGYTFGVDSSGQRVVSIKSGEHNILVYALFANLLTPLTGDVNWAHRGEHARAYFGRLWNDDGGYFHVGSDRETVNTATAAENVQSYSYLAFLDRRYEGALDWAKTNLATTDTPQSLHASFTGNLRFSGVSFTTASRHPGEPASDPKPDPDAVWFEGSAHMIAALLGRRRGRRRDLPTFHGDLDTASRYLEHIMLAQGELGRGQTVNGLAVPDGSGVVTASSVLDTSFGYSLFPVLQISAASWYLIAAHGGNPFRL